MKRLGVRDGGHRDQPDAARRRRDPRSDQDGVEAGTRTTGVQGVLDGENVQQCMFGDPRLTRPVAATGDRFGGRSRPPGLRVPAVAVEGDAEIQGVEGHHFTV